MVKRKKFVLLKILQFLVEKNKNPYLIYAHFMTFLNAIIRITNSEKNSSAILHSVIDKSFHNILTAFRDLTKLATFQIIFCDCLKGCQSLSHVLIDTG